MIESLRTDQQQRWRSGERVLVEWYAERHPGLVDRPAELAELILNEMALRAAAGESPGLAEYFLRFPVFEAEWQRRLAIGTGKPPSPVPNDPFATCIPAPPSGPVSRDSAPGAKALAAVGAGQVEQETICAPQRPDDTREARSVAASAPPVDPVPAEAAAVTFDTIAATPADSSSLDTFIERAGGPQIPGFEVLKELGRGGMGIVYQARQLSADRFVALKVVRNDVLDTLPMETRTSTLERFQQEAQAAAKLQHDNLVTVYEVGTASGMRYYAMRFVDGRSLIDMLREAPLDNRRAAGYLEPVSRALQYAHEQGILHRDLKPHNILVDKHSDRPLVADFGLAKFMERRDELTMAGEVMGTPSYMPPEQTRDAVSVTATADVYSLGATLYHLLTLRPPFQAANVAETIRQIIDEEPVNPRQLNPAIDRDLETICLKCLQKEPARRYASAGLLADDLRRYLNGEPILARPISWLGRTWRWCRRKPVQAGLTAVAASLVLVTLAAIAIGTWNTMAALEESDHTLLQAMDAVDALFTDVSENDLFDEPGMKPFRKDLLERARDQYKALSDLRRKDYFLVWRRTDSGIGDAEVSTQYHTAWITQEMGSLQTAQSEFEEVRRRQQELLDKSPNERRRKALGNTLNALGNVQVQRGVYDQAVASYESAATIRRRLASEQPDSLESLGLLANTLMNLGTAQRDQGEVQQGFQQHSEAQKLRLKIRAELDQSPGIDQSFRDKLLQDRAAGLYQLALTEFELGPDHLASVDQHLAEASEAFEELVRLRPRSLERRYLLAICSQKRGLVKLERQDLESAESLYQRAANEIIRLAQENPEIPKYADALVTLTINQAELSGDDLPKAKERWNKVLTTVRHLQAANANRGLFRREEAVALSSLGNVDLRNGDSTDAAQRLTESLRLLQSLAADAPSDPIVAGVLKDTQADLETLASRKNDGK